MPAIQLSSPSMHYAAPELNPPFLILGRIKSIPLMEASIGSSNYIQNRR